MSFKTSLSFNASFPARPPHGLQSGFDYMYNCIVSKNGTYAILPSIVTNLAAILPLCALTLHLGFKQQGSGGRMSHFNLFTYHMAFIELINISGITITFVGIQTNLNVMTMLGVNIYAIVFCGQLMFHTLTCVERYVAVIHPVTYLGLRNTNGTRIRNITITCVWLLSFATTGFLYFSYNILIIIVSYCFVPAALTIMFFCSVSILCTLNQPKPGEAGRVGQQAEQTKLRAFRTITVILGVLVCRFGGNVLVNVLHDSVTVGYIDECCVLFSELNLSLPCSLVLPLLFLHNAGKLKCCRSKTKSGLRSN